MFNRSAPPGTVVPWLAYSDVAKAAEWLSGAFGFGERLRTPPGPDGSIHHLQLTVGHGSVVLTGRSAGESQSTYSMLVPCADVDRHHERATMFGAQIVQPPTTREYGERQYTAKDLEGHRWTFSQSVADLMPEQWGAHAALPAIIEAQAAVAPMLSVRNGSESVKFYKEAFDASELFRIGNDDGAVVARMGIGRTEFWVADESPEHLNFSPETLGGGSARMVLTVANPDAMFERAIKAGAKSVAAVADQPYGWRVGRVVDPFGHHWEIGKPI